MVMTSGMAKITIRSTFALDPETVADLDGLAGAWDVSKSEALRRIIQTAALIEEVDAASDSLRAFEELHERLALTPEKTEAWRSEVRGLREGWVYSGRGLSGPVPRTTEARRRSTPPWCRRRRWSPAWDPRPTP